MKKMRALRRSADLDEEERLVPGVHRGAEPLVFDLIQARHIVEREKGCDSSFEDPLPSAD
jgi:hypothetical protein